MSSDITYDNTAKPLSTMEDWELENDDQDIRGYKVYDAPDHIMGTVQDMLVDRDAELVSAVRLDNGRQLLTERLIIGDNAVYLKDTSFQTPYIKTYPG